MTGGSVDLVRQVTAGGKPADIVASADYVDIDDFLKPAGAASYDIVFANGRMVLGYSQSGIAAKNLPAFVDANAARVQSAAVRSDRQRRLVQGGADPGRGRRRLAPVPRPERLSLAPDVPARRSALRRAESLQQPAPALRGAPGDGARERVCASASSTTSSSSTSTARWARRRPTPTIATRICPTTSTCPIRPRTRCTSRRW